MSDTPFVSFAIQFDASDAKATKWPSALTAGAALSPFPCVDPARLLRVIHAHPPSETATIETSSTLAMRCTGVLTATSWSMGHGEGARVGSASHRQGDADARRCPRQVVGCAAIGRPRDR